MASVVQGHGGECDSSKAASDLKYLETARKIVGEYMAAGKPKEEISKLSIEMFLSAERCEQLQQGYKTWVHEENLSTIFDELRKTTTLQAET